MSSINIIHKQKISYLLAIFLLTIFLTTVSATENLQPQILSVKANCSAVVAAGTTVRWTAEAVGEGSLEYAWYVYRNGEHIYTQWYCSQNYLDYTLVQPGEYKVRLFVRSLPGDLRVSKNSSCVMAELPPPPEIISIQANKSSPQYIGTTVRWTAEAVGEGTLEYAWYVYRDGEHVYTQWYRSQNYLDYNLVQPGEYKVRLFVRSLPGDLRVSKNSSCVKAELPPPPEIISIQSNKSSPQYIGTTIRWTAEAVGEGALEYAWYVYRDGEQIYTQWYRSQNYLDYKLVQPGEYKVRLFVRSLPGDLRVSKNSSCVKAELPPPPEIISIQANKSSPQYVGTTVRWTAEAAGEGALEYAWYVYRDGEHVYTQWYCSKNYLDYKLDQPGEYTVRVFVRSLPWDLRVGKNSLCVKAELPPPPKIKSIQTNKSSPQYVGTTVRWTAEAVGEGTLEYAWYVYRDGEHIYTQWYRSQSYLDYKFVQPGEYKVRLFVRSLPWDLRVGRNSDQMTVVGQRIDYTSYNITLTEAYNIQMGLETPPQTDQYRNEPAYIHSSLVAATEQGIVNEDGVRIRTQPYLADQYIYTTVNRGTPVTIEGEVTGDEWRGSNKWYKVRYDGKSLYVHSLLVDINGTYVTTSSAHVREAPNLSAHIYATVASGTGLSVIDTVTGESVNGNNKWYKISFRTWRNAKPEDVLYYLNPNNNDMFQHLVLSSSAGVSANQINNLLLGKGILQGKGQAFIEAGLTHSLNEVYLVVHALHETNNGTSELATGVEVGKNSNGDPVLVTDANRSQLTDIKKVYNMFGIGAADSDPLRLGAIRAYNENWTTPEAAIIGGARFIGQGYIHGTYQQDTLYKMRWNPANPGYPQYATDVAWAVKQVATIKQLYNQLENPVLHFDIPVYE